jgi:hypothetical protein
LRAWDGVPSLAGKKIFEKNPDKGLTKACKAYYNTIGHAMGIIKPE